MDEIVEQFVDNGVERANPGQQTATGAHSRALKRHSLDIRNNIRAASCAVVPVRRRRAQSDVKQRCTMPSRNAAKRVA